MDFFDASINRVGAWVIGARSTAKAILSALLEPTAALQELEAKGRLAAKLELVEETKTLPMGAVWDKYCLNQKVPVGAAWIDAVEEYEKDTLPRR